MGLVMTSVPAVKSSSVAITAPQQPAIGTVAALEKDPAPPHDDVVAHAVVDVRWAAGSMANDRRDALNEIDLVLVAADHPNVADSRSWR
jgi:hypothetical protein